MQKCLNHFKVTEFADVVTEYFDMEFSFVENEIRKRKLAMSKSNIVELILLHIKKEKWPTKDILHTAFDIDLEYVQKNSRRFVWVAHKFTGDSSKEVISDLEVDLRRAIRNDKRDALVLTKFSDGIFWISVVMKNLKKTGLYNKPYYVALAESGKYVFIKCVDQDEILKVLGTTLGYEKYRRIKLSGKDIKTLLKLLVRRENVDMSNRPVYQGGKAVETEYGLDMTNKRNFEEFLKKCMDDDEDIQLQDYTITASNCPWTGDNADQIKQMQFESSITFSGNVARIMKALPVASIVRPPFPDFLVNFSVEGKNRVRVFRSKNDTQFLSQESQK